MNENAQIKLLMLTKYGRLGASSRLRSLQYIPYLAANGINISVNCLIDDAMLSNRYANAKHQKISILSAYVRRIWIMLNRKKFDTIWIEKEALPWFPAWLERMLLRGVPYILDYDDAIFHNYDLHKNQWVRRIFGRRLDKLMKHAKLVIAGNEYLAKRARDAGAKWVEVLPTVVDLERYTIKNQNTHTDVNKNIPIIVWIGSPSTVKYVEQIKEPLQKLAKDIPFRLRIIGAKIDIPDIHVECVEWSEETEAELIRTADIGIMPLENTPWEQGKCGYKLIQYMACGLPVVASAIGANNQIVVEGSTGMLVTHQEDWKHSLTELLNSEIKRQKMGIAARVCVENGYCVQQTAIKLNQYLNGLHV